MNVAFVRVLKVINFPKYTGSSLCGYRVLVHILPKDEGSYGTLDYIPNNDKGDYLTSQVTWNFLYDDVNTSSVAFSFFYDDYHFANLKLPLFWFQKNTVVRYSFPARLLQNVPASANEQMMVKVAIHLSENKEAAFLAPKGSLLVTPKWKTSASQKNQQHISQQLPPQTAGYNQYPPLTVSEPQSRITQQPINQQAQTQIYQQRQQYQTENQYQQPPPSYQQDTQRDLSQHSSMSPYSSQTNIPSAQLQQPQIPHSSLSPYPSQNSIPNNLQPQQSQIPIYSPQYQYPQNISQQPQHSSLSPNPSINSVPIVQQPQQSQIELHSLSPNQTINSIPIIQQPQQNQVEHHSLSPNQTINSIPNALQAQQYPSIPLISESQEQKQQAFQEQATNYTQQNQLQQPNSFIPPILPNQEFESQIKQNEDELLVSSNDDDDDGALDNLGFAQDSENENNNTDHIGPQILQTQLIQNNNINPQFQESQSNSAVNEQQQQNAIAHPPKIDYPPFPTQQLPVNNQSENVKQQGSPIPSPPQSQPMIQYSIPPQIQQTPPMTQYQSAPLPQQPVAQYQQPPPLKPMSQSQSQSPPPSSQPPIQYPPQSPPPSQSPIQYPPQPSSQPPIQYPPQSPPIVQQQIPPQPPYVSPYQPYSPPVQPYAAPPPPPSYYQYNLRSPYQPYVYQAPPPTFVQPQPIPVAARPPPPPQTRYNVIIQSNRPIDPKQQYIVRQPQVQQPPPPYPYPYPYPYPPVQYQYQYQPQPYAYRPQYTVGPLPPPPPQSYYMQQPPPPFSQANSSTQNLPETAPKKKQYEISPLPPGTPSKVNIPPPVTFDPSKSYIYQQQQQEQEEQRKKTKNAKIKDSQQLGNSSQQFSLDPSQQKSTSMLEESYGSDPQMLQPPQQTGDKIASIGNDGFDSNGSLKPLNVPTSNFSNNSLEKSSNNPIMDDQKQSYFLPQYPSE